MNGYVRAIILKIKDFIQMQIGNMDSNTLPILGRVPRFLLCDSATGSRPANDRFLIVATS